MWKQLQGLLELSIFLSAAIFWRCKTVRKRVFTKDSGVRGELNFDLLDTSAIRWIKAHDSMFLNNFVTFWRKHHTNFGLWLKLCHIDLDLWPPTAMWLTVVDVKKFPLGGSVMLAVTSVHALVWKVERSKRYAEGMARILSPRPPTGARRIQKQNSGPEGEHSESSESVSPNMRWTNSADRESVISLFKICEW